MDDAEKRKNYERAEKLLAEQNFAAAVIAGAVATVIAVFAYGIVVSALPIAYGFAAVGVGIIIGLAMQFVGRGVEMKFSVVATVYTLIGCVVGNSFDVTGLSPAKLDSAIDVFRNNSFLDIAERVVSGISGVHLVYWFVAVFAAIFFARRALSRADRLALGLLGLRD